MLGDKYMIKIVLKMLLLIFSLMGFSFCFLDFDGSMFRLEREILSFLIALDLVILIILKIGGF